ncbi:MAG: electron transport complex subunit RsxE [Finegoldia sp.]|nr:electron transport complex subunit RsxE [Finegoldia sp.]
MDVFTNSILKNNPVLIQLVGLCSVLGVSTSLQNALGMSLAFSAVLVLSNVVISLLRNFIPDKVRIPAYIVVIATFVTLVSMLLEAFVPALYSSLGAFVPLIVVNCIILARAESFASQNGVFLSFLDGLSNGLGYTLVICITAFIRELLGSGKIFGNEIIPGLKPIGIFAAAPGAFMVLGFLLASYNWYNNKKKKKALEGGK